MRRLTLLMTLFLALVIGQRSFPVHAEELDENAFTGDGDGKTQAADAPHGRASDDDLKKMRGAVAARDEGVVAAAANKVLGEDPKNLEALNTLAVHYYNAGKFGLAKIVLRRALNDYKDVPALHNNLGVIFFSEGEQKQAIASYKRALEINQNYPVASANLGSIYLDYRDYKKAAQTLGAAYESAKSDLRRGSGMDIANNYATALSGAGELEKAKDVFTKILHVYDQNPATLYSYAVLLVARMKDKNDGEKIIAKLKAVADDSFQRKVEDLEKMLSGN